MWRQKGTEPFWESQMLQQLYPLVLEQPLQGARWVFGPCSRGF